MKVGNKKVAWLLVMAVALLLPLIVAACGEATPAPAPAPAPTAAPAPAPAMEPITLRFTSPLPPPPYSAAIIAEWWGQEIEKRTNGLVKFEFFHGGTLSKPKEELEAIQVGLGQAGFVVYPYYPTKLALGGFSYAVPFGPDKAVTLLKAVDEMYATVPQLKAQVEGYNQKIIWHRVIGDYGIMSKTPVRTVADLKGMKVASIGAYHPKILAAAGAVPVSMPVSQRYQSLQTGVVDGSVLPFDLNKNIRTHELVKYGTILGMGAAFSTSVTFNAEVWNKLPADIQEIILQVGAEASKKYAAENDALGMEAIEEMKAAGVEFIELPAAEKAKWAEMLPDFPAEWAREMNEKGQPGTRVMAAYLEITEKAGVKHARQWGTK
ncbi:MAG: C4-dicarboxylate TRAP transporter substrate-binding protein [Dehalococcoidia bacterium]